jgi:hypothetical protein
LTMCLSRMASPGLSDHVAERPDEDYARGLPPVYDHLGRGRHHRTARGAAHHHTAPGQEWVKLSGCEAAFPRVFTVHVEV